MSWKDQTLTSTFRKRLDILAVTNATWQRDKGRSRDQATFIQSSLSTVDALLTLSLTATVSLRVWRTGMNTG